ncbi:hypothetical protein ABG82_06765 [Mycobacteroides immunogenum]|nr:hypothetical protein [Mycobacteroides immunogenum]AMT70080.1 hypothetical protein ABG82_06765 [Mycobacteroides immunogenum]ANO03144.1 hypothetical protein BAB75_06810 [Mycobacteroides immunogenum]KIU40932.1 hypothetical protein TL11_09990 [Mycobacteroides immunogenum]MCV7308404.1 hypothetical protein [Mycobacteroides immunogenum]ORV80413.1 hypothetical protein AWC10_00005 [Mycobacteroides immunogenum]
MDAAVVVFPVAAVALAAVAHAGPQGYGDPEVLITSLEEEGNYVILNRVGNLPVEDCMVTQVRQGPSVYRFERPVGSDSNTAPTKILDHGTYYVDLKC